MTKRLLFIVLFLLIACASSQAQSTCTISNSTPFRQPDGSFNPTIRIVVTYYASVVNGVVIGTPTPNPQTYKPSASTGIVTFTATRGQTVTIFSPDHPAFQPATTVVVPSSATYDLMLVANLTGGTVPPATGGFTVVNGSTTFRAGTFNISGSGVTVSESPARQANLVFNGGSGSGATSVVNDTNVTGSIVGSVLTLGWASTLADGRIASAATWNAKVGPTRTLNAGTGLTGGGDLSQDRTFSVTNDSTTQRVDIQKDGSAVGTRKALNFITGSNTTLTVADNPGSNRIDVTVASSASAGSRWDQATNPSGNLALSHGANTTIFTWGSTTGNSVDMLTLKDTASNTGTGHILTVNTAASSAAKPILITAGGTSNGVEMSTAGLLGAVGAGGLDAAALVANSVPLARLSGITTSQLSNTAGIVNGQLANSAVTVTAGSGLGGGGSVSLGGSVTLTANVTTVFGRNGSVVATTNDYTWAQVDKTTSSLADITTRSAADLNAGILLAGRMPALTGDVISSSGAVATSIAAQASSFWAGKVTDETGSGLWVFSTSPSFTTDIRTPLVIGSTSAAGNLTLKSTTNAAKGKVVFGNAGTTVYDEATERFGVGTNTPARPLHVYAAANAGARFETPDASYLIYTGSGTTGFGVYDETALADRFIIDSSGNVTVPVSLIGGSSAGSTLTIKGTSNGSPSNAHIILNQLAASGATKTGGVFIGAAATAVDASDMLHIQGPDAQGTTTFEDSYGTTGAPQWIGRRARGTNASPSAVQSGDALLSFVGIGYHSSGAFPSVGSASVAMFASESHTVSAKGAYIDFYTTATGTTTVSEKWRIEHGGWLVGQELSANPTTSELAAGNQAAIYVKSDKLVIAYNQGGTIKYIVFTLDGSTTTFTNSSSAP